ncbi:MAG: aldehyde dehydrogenase family protein [Gammaproteobacteria bacterium]|nr:aldehyde dehydrogenase family protein [Gammaproteobacteria bacterium]
MLADWSQIYINVIEFNLMGKPNLPDLSSREYPMLIGGKSVFASDGERLPSTSPVTQQALTSLPNAAVEDVDKAVKAADAAQKSWRAMTVSDRQNILSEVSQIIKQNGEEWGMLDSLENGNVYASMKNDAAGGAFMLDYFIGIANELKGESTQLDNNVHYTRREPYGVVAKLLPFNHPIQSLAAGLAPVLLTGNTLIIKPSPHTSLSALAFGEAIKDVVPAGVINVITGSNERAALGLLQHPGIPRLSVTGSTDVGRLAMREGAEHLKTLTLELGGKTPMIVFDDADLALSVDSALMGMNLGAQGHSCSSTSRVLVHEALYDDFVDQLASRFEEVRVGDPFDETTQMGPISHKGQMEKIQNYLKTGRQEGARLVCGGQRLVDNGLERGLFLSPAVFADVSADMRIAREEIYGPVISVIKWKRESDAIEMANSVEYGLSAVIMTQSLDRAHRVAHQLESGYVEINGPTSFPLASPFGGVKHSGMGREGNMEELISYTQLKSINIRING